MEAFVYCWTDHKTGKLYIGSHKGSSDDGYICSSKTMLEQYKERPNDFSRHIIADGAHWAIRYLEYKILESVNAKHNPKYYNQHNGNGDFYSKQTPEETKKKQSKSAKSSWLNPSEKRLAGIEKMRATKTGRKRGPHTEEHKQKIGKANAGNKRPDIVEMNKTKEHREMVSKHNRKRKNTKYKKSKIKE